MEKVNRIEIDATLKEKSVLRYTPAGVAVQEVTLAHQSQQDENGTMRQVQFEIFAITFGDEALALSRMPLDVSLHCIGFLCRRWRTGTTLSLHITHFEKRASNI